MKKDRPPGLGASQSLIKTSSNMTGRQLFEKEHKDEINATATERREASSEGGPNAGMYQTVLKEMWDEELDKEEYEKRANELAADIPQ
jgi:hypothetical protein